MKPTNAVPRRTALKILALSAGALATARGEEKTPSILPLILGAAGSVSAAITETSFTTCSLLGGSNDSVRGARILSDGSVMLELHQRQPHVFCVRLQAGAETHAVDARPIRGRTVIVCGGTTSAKPEPFWTRNAIQTEAPPKSGFFAVFVAD